MANFSKAIPDTLTSWVITGFSLNDKTGFGMSGEPTNIRVFQPFFVSLNLPHSVKRGEIIAIPVVLFNYMSSDMEAQVTLDNSDDEFSFTDAEDKELDKKEMTKRIQLPSNTGATVSFMIYPRVVGEITLKVKAVTPLAGDSVHQKLKVEPEGVTQYKNEALFLNLSPAFKDAKHVHIFKADIPSDAVVDSEFLEFTAVSDILGPTVQNIENLVHTPSYGGFDQNMASLCANMLFLDYIEATKMDNPILAEKAKNHMSNAYQRQLTFRQQSGSFNPFNDYYRSRPDNWQTAYVVRSFIQARKYITIDETIIEKSLEFLATNQNPNGEFAQIGAAHYSALKDNYVALTSYILLAFLEDEVSREKIGRNFNLINSPPPFPELCP